MIQSNITFFLNNLNFRSSSFSMGEQMMNKMKNTRMAGI